MEKLEVKIIGQSPLLMHNIQLANPLNRYVKALKPLTAKRNKTDADLMEISRIEWEGGLYLEDGKVVIPDRCFNACFFGGAKKRKNGPKWRTGAVIERSYYPLEYPGKKIKADINEEIPNPSLDKYYQKFSNQDMVVVGGSRVLRTRPIFYEWSCDVSVLYDENILDHRTLLQTFQDSGYLIGLMERRPSSKNGGTFGRFEVEEIG